MDIINNNNSISQTIFWFAFCIIIIKQLSVCARACLKRESTGHIGGMIQKETFTIRLFSIKHQFTNIYEITSSEKLMCPKLSNASPVYHEQRIEQSHLKNLQRI